jgi:hypothetical protein
MLQLVNGAESRPRKVAYGHSVAAIIGRAGRAQAVPSAIPTLNGKRTKVA